MGADSLNFIGMFGYISSSCVGTGRGWEQPQQPLLLGENTWHGAKPGCARALGRQGQTAHLGNEG